MNEKEDGDQRKGGRRYEEDSDSRSGIKRRDATAWAATDLLAHSILECRPASVAKSLPLADELAGLAAETGTDRQPCLPGILEGGPGRALLS